MKNQELIKTLNECAAHCNHCADACLDEQDIKMMVRCIRLDRICAATCTATAQALAVNSEDIAGLVKYCQEICEKCGAECAQHQRSPLTVPPQTRRHHDRQPRSRRGCVGE